MDVECVSIPKSVKGKKKKFPPAHMQEVDESELLEEEKLEMFEK